MDALIRTQNDISVTRLDEIDEVADLMPSPKHRSVLDTVSVLRANVPRRPGVVTEARRTSDKARSGTRKR